MYLLLILVVITRSFISGRGESCTYYLSWWLYREVLFQVVEHVESRVAYLLFILVVISGGFISGRGASCTYYLSWWLYSEVLFQIVERHVLITYLGGYIGRFYFRSWIFIYLLLILVVITRSFISGRGESCTYYLSWWLYREVLFQVVEHVESRVAYLLFILVVISGGFISGRGASCTYYLSWWLYSEVLFQIVERHVLITYLGGYIGRFYFRSWIFIYLLLILVVILRCFFSGRGASCTYYLSWWLYREVLFQVVENHVLITYLGGYIERFYFRSWSMWRAV